MVGMIGESDRMQGDAFSDNVNLTSRIEGLTKYYGVSLIISEETYMRLSNPSQYNIRFLGRVQVKGRERPIGLFEVFDADCDDQQVLKRETLPTFSRAVDLYLSGQFAEAEPLFRDVLEANPEDKTAKYYLGRTLTYLAEGIPQGWSGFEIMTSK
jgi:adenylate cyclase